MKFIVKIILSLILGGAVMYFTGNLILGGAAFLIILILMTFIFRGKKKPLTKEQAEAITLYNRNKNNFKSLLKKKIISPEKYNEMMEQNEVQYKKARSS